MKVSELIEKLYQHDPEADVWLSGDYDGEGHLYVSTDGEIDFDGSTDNE